MARLLADENVPRRLVEALRERGHDVLTAQDAGLANRALPDADLLARASQEGRALLTFDRDDFTRLHRASADHAGIVACRDDRDRDALARRIDGALGEADPPAGRLLHVGRAGWTIEGEGA